MSINSYLSVGDCIGPHIGQLPQADGYCKFLFDSKALGGCQGLPKWHQGRQIMCQVQPTMTWLSRKLGRRCHSSSASLKLANYKIWISFCRPPLNLIWGADTSGTCWVNKRVYTQKSHTFPNEISLLAMGGSESLPYFSSSVRIRNI